MTIMTQHPGLFDTHICKECRQTLACVPTVEGYKGLFSTDQVAQVPQHLNGQYICRSKCRLTLASVMAPCERAAYSPANDTSSGDCRSSSFLCTPGLCSP